MTLWHWDQGIPVLDQETVRSPFAANSEHHIRVTH
jgi:hypothetical protein